MNLVLFGAPGSGKGTQSALLVQKGFKHFSTGDLFRTAIKNQTEVGKVAKGFIDKGLLVPDQVTVSILKEAMTSLDGEPFILDGFPRNIQQAQALEVLLKELKLELDKAIFLHIDQKLLKDRLVGRRVCRGCGAVYHVSSKPTKSEGVCDICQGQVVQRPDDMQDVIEDRLKVYETSTAPLKDYYQNKGLFIEVDGTGSQSAVFERILKVIHCEMS